MQGLMVASYSRVSNLAGCALHQGVVEGGRPADVLQPGAAGQWGWVAVARDKGGFTSLVAATSAEGMYSHSRALNCRRRRQLLLLCNAAVPACALAMG